MKKIVLFHGGCCDGFGAALAAYLKFGDKAKYIPCSFGSNLPSFAGDTEEIYIFDFSFPREVIEGWQKTGYKVVLRDHHISAQKKIGHVKGCFFDMSKSGAVLAWEYLHPNEPIPLMFKYIQDSDLWEWKLPNSDAINLVIRATDKDFSLWNTLRIDIALSITSVIKQGQHMAVYRDNMLNQALADSKIRWRNIGGHVVPTVNNPNLASEIGNALCRELPDAPFAGVWYEDSAGRERWSLMSIGDFDVSEVAAQYGGGGHKNASGFTSD